MRPPANEGEREKREQSRKRLNRELSCFLPENSRSFSFFDPLRFLTAPTSSLQTTNPPLFQERADGTNVGGWHWQERDVLPWAQERLRELLGGADVISSSSSTPALSFKTGPEVETSGEAVVNSRKGKLIPAYELTLKGTWKEKGDKGERNKGDWEIYLADENQDEEAEIKTSVAPGAGEAAEDSARAFRDAAKVGLVPKLRDFVKELAAGGGGSDGASSADAAAEEKAAAPTPAAAKSDEPAETKKAAPAAAAAAAPAPKPSAPSSKGASTMTTLKLTEKFYCRPSDLFEALTDPRKVMAFTQAPAEIEGPSYDSGNKYSIFAGAVEASFAEGTDAGKHRIELDWRFKEVGSGVLCFLF